MGCCCLYRSVNTTSLSLPPSPPDLDNGSPNYQNATALIVSFTVNNHLDDKQNQMAKIWEKAFLEYVSDLNLTFTNRSYSAEVRLTLFNAHTLSKLCRVELVSRPYLEICGAQ